MINSEQTPRPTLAARRTGWVRRVIMLAIAVVVTVAVARLLGRIDWSEVGQALFQLSWWQPLVLIAVLIIRQLFCASPLAIFIPGVSLFRATVNDLGATTMSVVAPPPSDVVLRVAMFTSWGVDPSKAVAGTVMNTLTLYVTRFSAPLVGFVFLLIGSVPIGVRWLDVISLLIAAALLLGVLLVIRTETWARWVGLHAGRLVGRFRRSIDPESWADACTRFRLQISERFASTFPRSLIMSYLMLTCDVTILLLALRFVGVGHDQVSVPALLIAYFFAYPLTVFPTWGIRVLDMVILAGLTQVAGADVQEPAIAALIIWRVFTIGGPLLLGLAAVIYWRRTSRPTRPAVENR